MNRKIIIPREIVTADAGGTILRNHAVVIYNGMIESIIHENEIQLDGIEIEVFHKEDMTLIPGFVQTHFHLCQTLFRGLADDLLLLDWLQKRIFPFENAHNPGSLKASAQIGIAGLQKSGTTTVLDMGTLRYQEEVFGELINSGMRAFSGKCMVDQNELVEVFKDTTENELNNTLQLAKEFHGSNNGRVNYGFAPRFVLSCSKELLVETKQMMKDFPGSIYHSHASENLNEVEVVRSMTGMENIEYFNSIGVLDDHTVMAHCIHVSDHETDIIEQTGMRVAHCPSANLKLGSGIAPIPKYLNRGISVSLGADGPPCNNHLDMFTEMRLSSLIQKPIIDPTVMDAEAVFRLATIEGAKALHIDGITGSIEPGKKADLVLLDLNEVNQSLLSGDLQIYSDIVYSASKHNVKDVMIEGEWVVRGGNSVVYDEKDIVADAKIELEKLLKRADV